MNDITLIFDNLIQQYDSIDIANSEFRKMLHEDDELQEAYSEWCHAVGCNEKTGFLDYCEEYMNSQDSIWDSLKDFDE